MARITLDDDRAKVSASEAHYHRLETGDMIYFPRTPFILTAEERGAAGVEAGCVLPQEHQLSPGRGSAPGRRSQGPGRVGSGASDHAPTPSGRSPSWPRSCRGTRGVEDRLRQLPTDRRGGAQVALRSRNDLIHIDNFPSRPSHGDRLLRISRTSTPTAPDLGHVRELRATGLALCRQGPPAPPADLDRHAAEQGDAAASKLGLPVVDRPPYDQFMLRFHHYMKESEAFQRDCPKDRWEFPPTRPGSSSPTRPATPASAASTPWSRPSSSAARAWSSPTRRRSRSWNGCRASPWAAPRSKRA